jgi:hypothetical protein
MTKLDRVASDQLNVQIARNIVMVTQPDKPAAAIPVAGLNVLGAEIAPFIYFDIAATFGANFGAIQLELFANTLIPDGKGGVETKVVATGHIRCSQKAALSLRQAIDGALEILSQTQPVPESQKN